MMKLSLKIALPMILAGLFLLPLTVSATPLKKTTLVGYYEACLTQPNQTPLSDEGKMDFCACLSASLQDNFSAEEYQNISRNDPLGQKLRQKMVLAVETPCLNHAVEDIILRNCVTDRRTQGMIETYPQICSCMSEDTAQFIEQIAPETVNGMLLTDPNLTDPLNAILESRIFQAKTDDILYRCVLTAQSNSIG